MTDRIAAFLRSETRFAALSPEERSVAFARVSERYDTPNPEIDAVYTALPPTTGASLRRALARAKADEELQRQMRLADEIMAEGQCLSVG